MGSMAVLVEDPNDPGTYIIRNTYTEDNPGTGVPGVPGSSPNGEERPTKLIWGADGERFYETGIDRGVLYPNGMAGVAWNGLLSVSESPSGGEAKPYYIDGFKYANSSSPEEFNASIEAYTYPDEFALCDGTDTMANGLFITQQRRKSFGLSYRTRIGNDISGIDHGYKLHIVYNAQANPTSKDYKSMGDSTEASTFSWDISTRPMKFQDASFGTRYGAHLILDSTVVYPWAMQAVENVLYGTDDLDPSLPSPQALLDLFVDNALLQITDNGDGTWTAVGPDEAITMLNPDTFQINWPSAVLIDNNTYTISSL